MTNPEGDQSNQTDIISYDNRVIPPFIKEQNLGVYPVESVVAAIEVKSQLDKSELLRSEKNAKRLHSIYHTKLGKYTTPNDYRFIEL